MTQDEANRKNHFTTYARTGEDRVIPNGIPAAEEAAAAAAGSDDCPDWAWLDSIKQERHEREKDQFEKQAAADKAEISRLQKLLNAADKATARPAWEPRVAAVTCADVKKQVGDVVFNHKFTRAQKLESLGVDPNVSDKYLETLFGHKADSAKANDLFKENPRLYRQLREAHEAVTF